MFSVGAVKVASNENNRAMTILLGRTRLVNLLLEESLQSGSAPVTVHFVAIGRGRRFCLHITELKTNLRVPLPKGTKQLM